MWALEIYINEEKKCVAGANNNVLNAILNAMRQPSLSVGGLMDIDGESVHVRWLDNEPLQAGDEVRIRLIETTEVDPPTTEHSCKTQAEKDAKTRAHLVEARDLLPASAPETGTATLVLFEERLTQENFPASMHILAELGQENEASASFWDVLGKAASSQARYEESRQYRAQRRALEAAEEQDETAKHNP